MVGFSEIPSPDFPPIAVSGALFCSRPLLLFPSWSRMVSSSLHWWRFRSHIFQWNGTKLRWYWYDLEPIWLSKFLSRTKFQSLGMKVIGWRFQTLSLWFSRGCHWFESLDFGWNGWSYPKKHQAAVTLEARVMDSMESWYIVYHPYKRRHAAREFILSMTNGESLNTSLTGSNAFP